MWRDGSVRRVILARFVSRVGGEAAFFVGIWGKASYQFGASAGELAVLMAFLGVASLAGSAAGGVLVDRFDPRRVVLVGEVMFVPATLSLIVAGSMRELTGLVILFALVGAVVFTAMASFPPHLTGDEERLHGVNVGLELAGTASFVVGPAAGAMIVRLAHLDWIFALDAVTSVIAALVVVGVRVRPAASRERSGALGELWDGFRTVYRSRPLRFYVGIGALTWLSFGVFGNLEPLFYRDVLGVGPEAMGWVLSLFGVGLGAGSLLLQRLPIGFVSARAAIWLAAGGGLGAVLYTGTDRLAVVATGAVLWGVQLGMLLPVLRTLVHVNTPEGLVGRVMGTNQAHQKAGELLPLTVVPVAAGAWGVQPVLVGTGAALFVLCVLGVPEGMRLDRARTRPVPPPDLLEARDEPISPLP